MRRPAEPGTVYLVGAGPGDPELITVKGLNLLRVADVVVYDRLIHPSLIDQASPAAETIYVGKKPGKRSCPQEETNQILVDHAKLGRSVVRLKGGDPFVFGRGGEECLALSAAGIPFQVVPGITSPISAPSAAGIPVTHRGVASSFTVVTGHSCTASEEPNWTALARAGTLIVLMGLRRLPDITEKLIASGIDPETPAAVIASATTGEQETVVGDLQTIGPRTRHLDPPATVVIGEVVGLRPWIAWFDERPTSDNDLFSHHQPVQALAS
ncbi:MAG: uroporphyrinogen-III C-methyltransferase [Rhodothermales bacterium]